MIQKCKKNFRYGWKTTALGIVLIAVGIALLIDQRTDLSSIQAYSFGGLIVLGCVFLFSPDDFITLLKNKLK